MKRVYHYKGSRDEARRRLDEAMTKQAASHPRFRPFYRWTGAYRARAQFHVPLFNFEQAVEVSILPDRIEVSSRLPRLLKVFLPRITEVLDRHARLILDDMLGGTA